MSSTETEKVTTCWDPYAEERANKLQQVLLKGKHEFQFLNDIAKQEMPLTLDQLRDMSTDYDKDLDDAIGEIPET